MLQVIPQAQWCVSIYMLPCYSSTNIPLTCSFHTLQPSLVPSSNPSYKPSGDPSYNPTGDPTSSPTKFPSRSPIQGPAPSSMVR
mmetsp:Transcript_2455/g.3753  ORF Transcript_2455/g.3753 Transcript_2455/m.3753 type:complete len:84 (+) Transcript_2455:381-632(+)